MAHSNVLLEIEKSSDKTISRERFFHEVWSNEKTTEQCTLKEFNNGFPSYSDLHSSAANDLTFHNETENASTIETLPENPKHELNIEEPQPVNEETPQPVDESSGSKKINEDSESNFDFDSVDYFDSEDEFFETYRNEVEEYLSKTDFGMDFRNTDEKDRYCQGVSQYYNMPVFMKSLKKFADDNNFEIHDVMADGNCLFRAIADQLVINGIFGNSPTSLRENTIKYLRQNPYQEDGSHTDSFLLNENWEQYLMRMESPSEWCDHIVLKAAVDALALRTIVFNVYGNDVRRTEILPANCRNSSDMMTIYLGHLGEFHYLSLRPNTWEREWQKKALLFRYMICSKEMDPDSREDFLKEKINILGLEEFVEQNISFLGIESNYKTPSKDKENTSVMFKEGCLICPTYALSFLEPEECEAEYWYRGDTEVNGTLFRYLGSRSSGTDVYLSDIIPKIFARTEPETTEEYGATVVSLTLDVSRSSLIQDIEATYPGYLRLKVPPSSTDFLPKSLYRSESYTYLKKLFAPQELTMPRYAKKCFMGIICKDFPPVAEEWKYRQRKMQWPSNEVVKMIVNSGCTIIPKHHPSSVQPGIEWKYDFSVSEAILFHNGLSLFQLHGFFLIKILLDHCTSRLNCRLKNKHIRSAFLNSCELIPIDMWMINLGGSILYAISYLTTCLQKKNLPNYFIPKRNMLFGFSDEDINAIFIQVEALRLFPHQAMVHIAELHGLRYAANLTTLILQDCKRFSLNLEIWSVYRDILLPVTIKTVKFLTRRGLYNEASMLLCYMFGNQPLYEHPRLRTRRSYNSSAEFFCNALSNLKQEISRVMVAMDYETTFCENILDLLKLDGIFLKDILPLEADPNIAWLRIPEDKIDNYELVAEFLYEFGKKELKRLNCKLAELAFSEAIQCLERTIKHQPNLDVSQIEDEMLKMDIQSQGEDILRKQREKVKNCYLQIYHISKIHRCYDPLQKYMLGIEELCKDLPYMSCIVSEMYAFLRIPNKQKEYAELFERFLRIGDPFLLRF
uniref:OTU domain-containing protein n=1 Tax=Magallana gigas TaxID=29159 RepID=A0A8W8KE68_MAGGI